MKKTDSTLIVFTLMNFVLSMTAFVFSAILDKAAVDIGVSVAEAGLLNTMFSLGAAIGVPVTLVVFRKIDRTALLKVMLLFAALLNLLLTASANFQTMLLIRLLSGIAVNGYGVLAVAAVVALVSKERMGRSLAFLIAGNSLSLVVGIPLARALSDMLNWRIIFLALSLLMAGCLVYFQLHLRPQRQDQPRLDFRSELELLKNPRVLLILLFTLIMFLGYHGAYNYVAPYLMEMFPSAPQGMSVFLMLFGLGSFFGNYLGGLVSDRIGYARSMLLGAAFQTAVTLLMLLLRSSLAANVILVTLWVMSAWFMGLQLNAGIAGETNNRSSFLLSLNGSAIQLGSAMGTSLAAVLIANGLMRQLFCMSLLTALAVTLLQVYSLKTYHHKREDAAGPSE